MTNAVPPQMQSDLGVRINLVLEGNPGAIVGFHGLDRDLKGQPRALEKDAWLAIACPSIAIKCQDVVKLETINFVIGIAEAEVAHVRIEGEVEEFEVAEQGHLDDLGIFEVVRCLQPIRFGRLAPVHWQPHQIS